MKVGIWLLLAGFFWVCGFLQLKLLDPNPDDELVFVPKWMFLIFGAPRHKDVPVTVMHARSVYLQLMGLILAVNGLLIDRNLVMDPLLSGLLGFLGSMLFGGIVAKYIYRKQPYMWQDGNTLDE